MTRALSLATFAAFALAFAPAVADPTAPPSAATDTSATIVFPDGTYTGSVRPEYTQHPPIPVQPKAKVTFADGKSHAGATVIPDGHGEYTYADGWKLDANFVDGKPDCAGTPPDCSGTLTGPGGFILRGAFKGGDATSGAIDYGNGDHYEGGLANGCLAGQGTYHSSDGSDARGTWQPVLGSDGKTCSGSRLTSGTVTDAKGARFDGSYGADGKPDGQGTFVDTFGLSLRGTWIDGGYSGRMTGVDTKSGRTLFEIDVAPSPNQRLDGRGTYYTLGGSRIAGTFSNGVLTGPATLVEASGATHAGRVTGADFASDDGRYLEAIDGRDYRYQRFDGPRDAAGRPNGSGTLRYAAAGDGRASLVLRGRWRHGAIVGPVQARVLAPCCTTFVLTNASLRAAPGSLGRRLVLNGYAKEVRFASGDVASGPLVGGALNGRGSYRYAANGCTVRGTFRNGKIVGAATETCGRDTVAGRVGPDGTVQ